ncbi:MAG: hypothetical protein FWE13_00635 [Firmicutes bacterium]|nr:hypothetical protein [Bacillota bacterium]
MNANILDFGTEKIFVGIARRGLNENIMLQGSGESKYAGFCDGEFLEPFKLPEALAEAISNAAKSARQRIEHIVVGVPGEFTTTVCKEVRISLQKKRIVTANDVDLLHEEGNSFNNVNGYTLINSQPIYYTLESGGRFIDPVGLESSKLGGLISYVLAENRFLDMARGLLKELGINSIEFVSTLVAQNMFLFDDVVRDKFVVLLDSGHLTTSVSVARGDGILAQYNVPIGGSHITQALSLEYDISIKQAENLKSKVMLNLSLDENAVYAISSTDSSRADELQFNAIKVNEIVASCIKWLASTVTKSLKLCTSDYPDYIPYHLTGGGLSYIKGAPDLLSKYLERPVEIIAPSLPLLEHDPHLSSSYALLDTALRLIPEVEKEKPMSFLKRLFRKR